MEQSTQVIIYDTEGNIIFNEAVNSPVIGLQTGETFWYGTQENRQWGRIIKITYGLDTANKTLVMELVVEASAETATKTFKASGKKPGLINHGKKEIEGRFGGSWSIEDGDILVTCGIHGIGSTDGISKFTLQVQSPSGPKIESIDNATGGTYIEVETEERKVVATISHIDMGGTTIFVTESVFS